MAKGYMNNISFTYSKTYKRHYFQKSSTNISDILCYKYITHLKLKVIDRRIAEHNKRQKERLKDFPYMKPTKYEEMPY